MNTKTLRTDEAWAIYQANPHDDAGDPWSLASRLERENARLRESAGWQPIETAPKDGRPIDIYSDCYGRLTNYRRVEKTPTNVFYDPCCAGPCCIRDASHWMPIPNPPTS